MTLAETKPELYRLRQDAVKRASGEPSLGGKLRLLGEAVAYEKVFDVVCRAIERDKEADDAAQMAGLLAKTYAMLCGGLEGESESDCEYYCGQMIGFTKAKALLSEGAEDVLA